MKSISNTRTPKINLGQAIEDYLPTLDSKAEKKNFLTAICRYTLPGFAKIKLPKGKRMSESDQLKLIEAAKSIEIENVEEILKNQKKCFKKANLPKKDRYPYESRVKSFVKFILANRTDNASSQEYQRRGNKYKIVNKKGKKQLPSVVALDKYPQHFEAELEDFKNFLVSHIDSSSEKSIKNHTKTAKKYLGWLYRNQKISYEEISLEALIPRIELYNCCPLPDHNYYDKDAWINLAYQKTIAEQKCKEEGIKIQHWLRDYFQKRNLAPGTSASEVERITTIAKYIYRNETDSSVHSDFQDIPIIAILRKLRRDYAKKDKARKKSKNQNVDGKMVSWQMLKDLLEIKRLHFEQPKYQNGHKVKLIPRADDLQRFLMLACFVIMPPDRNRTFVELSYGKTLKHGWFDEHNNFTPVDKMSNPQEAKYYIHLQEGDYKTWKTYGVWRGTIPNKEFDDGKLFYDYLDQWFFNGYVDENGKKRGYRDALNPQTDTVFVNKYGAKFSGCCLCSKIKVMVYGEYEIPTTPHTIRHIYVSHVCKEKFDSATLDSIAYWMKHSPEEARKTYSHLTSREKLRAANKAIESIPYLH